MRRIGILVIVATAGVLAGCGGSSPPAPIGSPGNPVPAKKTAETSEGAKVTKPGFKALVERQTSKPRSRFTPCNLVTAAQARAIIGAPMLDPIEAPQGPTCIYRSRDGKSFVTLGVQSLDFQKKVKPRLKLSHRIAVASRTAYCGTYGQPMLYLPLSGGRVLSIAAHCAVAKQFAAKAVRQLPA